VARLSGQAVQQGVRRGVRQAVRSRTGAQAVEELTARVAELEEEVRECRRQQLRLAELTDVVQELLLPLSQRDQAKVDELLERYTDQLG
jgi:hypothetical protein